MKILTYSLFLFFSLNAPDQINSQTNQEGNLHFQLKHLDGNKWGVFVIPNNHIKPSKRTLTGAGQVTIKVPAGFTYYNFKNHGGTWVENARITSPKEAKFMSYISFGFVNDSPKIGLVANESRLLFSFETDDIYIGSISLFENGNDPFETPNSYGTNPGNDIGMVDRDDDNHMLYYTYASNIIDPETESLSRNEMPYRHSGKAMLVSKKEGNEMADPNE